MIFLPNLSMFKTLRAGLPAFAMATDQDHVLFAEADRAHEVSLILHGIEMARKYLPLSVNDAVLLQDPAMGGCGSGRVTLVSRWQSADSGPGLLVATSIAHPHLETVRLPFAPLQLAGEINPDVIAALGPAADEILRVKRKLETRQARTLHKSVQRFLTSAAIKQLNKQYKIYLDNFFHDLPEGEGQSDTTRPGHPPIRLRLRSTGRSLVFDFTGTPSSSEWKLPLWATSGILWNAIQDGLAMAVPLHSELIHRMEFLLPQGCWLHTANGDFSKAMTHAPEWIRHAVDRALTNWNRGLQRPPLEPFDRHIEMRFADRTPLNLRIPAGRAHWNCRPEPASISIEKIESNYPVRIESLGKNGDEITLTLRALEQGEFQLKKGRAFHLIKNEEPIPVNDEKALTFKAGDVLQIKD